MTWALTCWWRALGEVHQPGQADAMALAEDMGHQMNPALGYLLGECWEVPKTMGHIGEKG